MRYGRRFSLPIDPWPQASLAERTAVGLVLTALLLVPFCAAGALMIALAALGSHIAWSYAFGAALRDGIARRSGAWRVRAARKA